MSMTYAEEIARHSPGLSPEQEADHLRGLNAQMEKMEALAAEGSSGT